VNSTDWFFPYVGESDKYALFDSVGAGNLFTPGALVNRGDVVQMLHRLHNAGVLN